MRGKLRKEFFKDLKKHPKLVRTGSAILLEEGKSFIPVGRISPRSIAQIAFINLTKNLGLKKKKRKRRQKK